MKVISSIAAFQWVALAELEIAAVAVAGILVVFPP